jgi:nucleoside-diphosphate-sugar epimerase|tara:strand:- start:1347 stop:2174 length:828 start_codon:yes stop_codon:yes gene_type:complete
MKHLILGSSGQIGTALTQWCSVNSIPYTEFDLVRDPAEDLRIENNERLAEGLADADFVMFLAYDVGGSRYLTGKQDQFQFISNNARLMECTFRALRESGKPFIFVSSQMANLSFSPYGALKAVGEHYTRALGGILVKLWNVYGVETDLEKSHVITDFIHKANETKCIDMLTDGTESRQFLHAEDCSRCLLTLAERYEAIPRDKNLHIASGQWHTVLEVAEIIAGLFPNAEIQPAVAKDEVQKDSRIDPDPFIRNYWKPKIDLEEGIVRVVRDMRI